MRRWHRILPWLVASLSIITALSGCLSPSTPDADCGAGGGQTSGEDGVDPPTADWDTLMARLPSASFEGFGSYNAAVLSALQTVYADDPHVVVSSDAPRAPGGEGEDSAYRFTFVWRKFAEDDPQPPDPLQSAAMAQVEFRVYPAEGNAPCLAGSVRGDEHVGWSGVEDVTATREAIMRMWHPLLGGYFSAKGTFWGAFEALHDLEPTGYLDGAGGEFLLPGPDGYDTSLWLNTTKEADGCSSVIVLGHVPEGAFPSQPEDWGTLTSTPPQPSMGPELGKYADWLVSALRRASAGQDIAVAETGAWSPVEGWWEKTITWLRFPVAPGDPGYHLEILTIRLTPGPGGSQGPVASSATVTELVAWDPEGCDTAQSFQSLARARDVFLESYLSAGDGSLEALAGLELTPGLETDLPALDGSKLKLKVEEVSQEGAALRVRYTLSSIVAPGR